jgi:MscS family membrane protein
MKIAGCRCSILLLLCCTLAFITSSFPARTFAASAKAPVSASAAKPAEPEPLLVDPLGRSTPYGTVMGFLRAVDKVDYELASNYLEGKQSPKRKAELARDLQVALNRGLKIGLDNLSRAPEGHLGDGLPAYLEKVGTATFGSESLDIVLSRTTKPDTPPIWLFSSETLLGVTTAADQLDLAWAEAIWPESFREIRFRSFPLFTWINVLVSILLLLGIAWLLTRGFLMLLRPLDLRHIAKHGESALARIKWLLFLLIFSLMARIVATQGATAQGRIFFGSLASVLVIVAVGWLLVRLTKLAARLKARHLRQIRLPGKIAAVELSSWLFVCLWFIAGLFLILRSLGIELTAAVAGLGIGGIAIAFAAQKTIENLFGTVMVVADEAIQVGDYCQAGTIEGRVESIGLRSTRIRTVDRALVSIPNGQLAAMSIGNLARRDKFLFRHNIRLRYETLADQVRHVLAEIRKMMSEQVKLESATIRTRLIRFGDACLELEVFAYVLTHDAEVFLEIQEGLLLRIIDIIEASGTAVALPSETAPVPKNFALDARARDEVPEVKKGNGLPG